ncbi:flagellar hook-length control protein FliK [Rummeliibacillus sp. JY-2-4R]
MNIEALKSNPVNNTISSTKVKANPKDFANILTEASNVASKKDQFEEKTSEHNPSTEGVESKKTSNPSTIIEEKTTESINQSNESQETIETNTASSRFTINLSNGLELLLGSVSKQVDQSNMPKEVSMDDLSTIINASSLQDLGDTLGLSLEQINSVEGLSFDKILQVIGIKKEELQKSIQQLTGDEVKAEDVWNILNGIEQNLPTFIQRLMASINGGSESTVSKSQVSQVLQFLKIVELVAPKTDLLLNQEYQTFQVKELISTLSANVKQNQDTQNEAMPIKTSESKQVDIKLVDSPVNQNISIIQPNSKEITTVTLNLPLNKTSQAEAFVKEFQAIMNRGQFANNAAGTKLLIKLYPENLGSIRVELIQRDGIMTARLLASTNIGKQMLESQLQQLKQGLVNQNIQLDRIDIAQTLNEPNRNVKDQQQQFQHAFKQHSDEQQKQQEDEKEENSNFNDFLMELEV